MSTLQKSSKRLLVSDLKLIIEAYRQNRQVDVRILGGSNRDQVHRQQLSWLRREAARLASPAACAELTEMVDYEGPCSPSSRKLIDIAFPGGRADATRLNEEEVLQLFEIVRRHPDPAVVRDFRMALRRRMATLPLLAKQRSVSLEQAISELKSLSRQSVEEKRLKGALLPTAQDEPVDDGLAHVDGFITTPGGHVIQTISYHNAMEHRIHALLKDGNDVKLALPDMRRITHELISPQSKSGVGCESLQATYMKVLLKNGGEELNRNCLLVQGFEDQIDFFLPSPAVLRYGESSLYNKVIQACIEGREDVVQVRHGRAVHEVTTLQGLKNRGLTLVHPGGRPVDLDAFRKQWLSSHEAAQDRRARMDVHNVNSYLSHVVMRMLEKARAQRAERIREVPGVSALGDIGTKRLLCPLALRPFEEQGSVLALANELQGKGVESLILASNPESLQEGTWLVYHPRMLEKFLHLPENLAVLRSKGWPRDAEGFLIQSLHSSGDEAMARLVERISQPQEWEQLLGSSDSSSGSGPSSADERASSSERRSGDTPRMSDSN